MTGLIDTLMPRWDRTVAGRSELAYWRVVGIGSALIRRDLLRAVRRRAEGA